MSNLRNRLLVILAVTVASVFLFHPVQEKINLGLDLRGGIHLVVQVLTEDALTGEMDQTREFLESEFKDKSIPYTSIVRQENLDVVISGVPGDQDDAVEDVLSPYSQNYTYSTVTRDGLRTYTLSMLVAYENFLRTQTVNQARTIIDRRINQYGVTEPSISVYGSGDVQDQIIIELPGVDDFGRIEDLIKNTGRMEMKLVHPDYRNRYASQEEALQEVGGFLDSQYELLPYREADGGKTFMIVRKAAALTGSQLKNARRTEDANTGRPQVTFFLTSEGVRLFTRTTTDHQKELLAIVLDDEIYSAPNIDEPIPGESAVITGYFSLEEADDLALVLRSGALPAGIRILENRSVGPSLGLDSIRNGIRASVLGMVLIVVLMLGIYRLSGVNAIVCLVLNLAILLGVLAYFRATLTLPGIAGVILTIGMAVDANILIFERIKEELRTGKTLRSAVSAGFGRVFWTIIDTNVTTLVAALFLFQFGTGPIRGFAVTLAVGLVANIFTAVFVSRTFFNLLLQRRTVQGLSI